MQLDGNSFILKSGQTLYGSIYLENGATKAGFMRFDANLNALPWR